MKNLLLFGLVLCASCTFTRPPAIPPPTTFGDTRTNEVAMLDANTYRLTYQSTDETYGYEMSNPVKVGGLDLESEHRYLNALKGPGGENLTYRFVGNCCTFETPNSEVNNIGQLSHYEITWDGAAEPKSIYLNRYDKGNLEIPVGLKARE